MKTVTKTFYVSENDFNLLKRNQDSNIVIRVKDESRCHGIDNKAIHPITISYQAELEYITLNESDLSDLISLARIREKCGTDAYSNDHLLEEAIKRSKRKETIAMFKLMLEESKEMLKTSLGFNGIKSQIENEEPEKKIEISESEFDEAVKYADKNYTQFNSYIPTLKQKLFGNKGE